MVQIVLAIAAMFVAMLVGIFEWVWSEKEADDNKKPVRGLICWFASIVSCGCCILAFICFVVGLSNLANPTAEKDSKTYNKARCESIEGALWGADRCFKDGEEVEW